MIELYSEIRTAHIWTIALSGLWMALRGLALLGGMHWPRHILAWAVEWVILASLVTAGVLLFTLLPREVFENQWLTVKLAFVALYLACGYTALIAHSGRNMRAGLLAGAMLCYLVAYSIARTHDPLGPLSGLML